MPVCRGSSAGTSGRRSRDVPAPAAGGSGDLARPGTLSGSFLVLPAPASTSKGMKTLLAARERALLPCFWNKLNLSMFSKGEKKPFQSCLAKGVTVQPRRPRSGDKRPGLGD